METNFTHNDLVKKIYNETSREEGIAIMEALENNWDLKEEYDLMLDSKKRLDAAKYTPSETSINIIMAHSRKTAPMTISW